MKDTVIATSGLSKSYRIGKNKEFLALRDVSFSVGHGEVVGVIGRNGAGKSTLLKILSRIVEPSIGRVTLRGRVGSLLEVGTGFHPELTGRENVFLSGALLGMKRFEIERQFDSIVAFGEIEHFLDVPVKRYSSGMYTRLAFAVMAHLRCEILIADEVLAVGDVGFQKKCLGKMGEAAADGRTVLFVSHNIGAVRTLCSRSILLDRGSVVADGGTSDVIAKYMQAIDREAGADIDGSPRDGDGSVRLRECWLEDGRARRIKVAASGSPLTLVFLCEAAGPARKVSLGFSLHNSSGERLCVLYADYMGCERDLSPGLTEIRFSIADLPLPQGAYYIGVRIMRNGVTADWPRIHVGRFDVDVDDFYGSGVHPHGGVGQVYVRGDWSYSTRNFAACTF